MPKRLVERHLTNDRCTLHDVVVQEDEVSIRYGLIRFSDEYLQVKSQAFPNATSFKVGGCSVHPPNRKLPK